MPPSIQRDMYASFVTANRSTIEDSLRAIAVAMRQSLHVDIVVCRSRIHRSFKARPCRRNAGIDDEKATLAADAPDALDAGAIHPPRGARVPGPSPAPDEIGRESCRAKGCQYG